MLQLNVWSIVLILIATLVFSFMFVFSIAYLLSWLKAKKQDKKTIEQEKEITKFNPGKILAINEKEVQEIGEREFNKFREFEKLRRLSDYAESDRGIKESFRNNGGEGITRDKRGALPFKPYNEDGQDNSRDESITDRTTKSIKSSSFHRPEFL